MWTSKAESCLSENRSMENHGSYRSTTRPAKLSQSTPDAAISRRHRFAPVPTEDAVQTIGGRNTRGDKSDSPGRPNEKSYARTVSLQWGGPGHPPPLWVRLPSSSL